MLRFKLKINLDNDLVLETPKGLTQNDIYLIERETESEVREVASRFLEKCKELPLRGKEVYADGFKETRLEFIAKIATPLVCAGDSTTSYYDIQLGANRSIALVQVQSEQYIKL
jgi:hypothetical protein